ncbi:MAG: transglutaminase domain-containing protein [Candidatus Altiarchaeota archaeon]
MTRLAIKALVIYLLIGSLFVDAEFDCADFPDEDIIIVLDKIEEVADFSGLLHNAIMPPGMEIISQREVSDEEFQNYLLDIALLHEKVFKEGSFLNAYRQAIRNQDGDYIVIWIETYSSEENVKEAYDKHAAPFFSEIRGLKRRSKLDDLGVQGVQLLYFSGTEQAIFYDDTKVFQILTEESETSFDDVQALVKVYSSLESTLSVNQIHEWKAKICKSNTPQCNQNLYFNPSAQSYKLLSCFTKSGNSDIECPKERINEFSSSLELPFPSCKEGNIISFKVETDSIFPMEGNFWSPIILPLQRTFPAEKIIYSITAPNSKRIVYESDESVPAVVDLHDGMRTIKWETTDQEPFEIESYMPDIRLAIPHATYSSVTYWTVAERWITKIFEEKIKPETVKSEVDKITQTKEEKLEIAKALYEEVRDTVRYEDSEIGFSTGYTPHSSQKVLEYGFGDCKDKSVLLTSMLRAADIEAYVALVSHKKVNKEVPNIAEFYHAITIAHIDGEPHWMDATCELCPFSYLPPSEQEVEVLVLGDAEERFVTTPIMNKDKNRIEETNYTVKLNEDGTADIHIDSYSTGIEALTSLDAVKDSVEEKEIKKEFEDILQVVCNDYVIKNYEMDSIADDQEFLIHIELNCSDFAEKSKNSLSFRIRQYNFFKPIIEDDKREFPLDIDFNKKYLTNTDVDVPEGYMVDVLPQDLARKQHFAKFDFSSAKNENRLKFSSIIDITESMIPVDGFNDFKGFFTELNGIENIVVLQKEDTYQQESKVNEPEIDQPTVTDTNNKAEIPSKSNDSKGINYLWILGPIGLIILLAIVFTLGKKSNR